MDAAKKPCSAAHQGWQERFAGVCWCVIGDAAAAMAVSLDALTEEVKDKWATSESDSEVDVMCRIATRWRL